MSIRLLHLFPLELSSSGDSGNVQTVAFRIAERGQQVEVLSWNGDNSLPTDVDAVFIGNGPWSAALRIQQKLIGQGDQLRSLHAAGVPFVAVGTGAELLAESITDSSGETYSGVGIYPFTARRDADRRVGYMRIETAHSALIGFGDFASEWSPAADAVVLGQAVVGDRPHAVFAEGVVVGSSVASRMGGPMLPLNDKLADHIISAIFERRGISAELQKLAVDEYVRHARAVIDKNLNSVFTTISL